MVNLPNYIVYLCYTWLLFIALFPFILNVSQCSELTLLLRHYYSLVIRMYALGFGVRIF
jgi:hypothetical protein